MKRNEVGETGVILYRPVGREELELIVASGFCEFPPRLPHQPIFYPLASEEYAHEIAKRWNTEHPASGGVGFVTRFRVREAHIAKYQIRSVGSRVHLEYWIPAHELPEFNRNIIGTIEVIAKYERGAESGAG